VDDTFTQNTNLLSFFIIFINLSNFSLYPKAICQGEQDVSQGDESNSIYDVNIDDLNVDCSI
jgi:hypothetical protein